MSGYLSVSAPYYKMTNRSQMNGCFCQNSCDDRSSVSNSRREDNVTSFGFSGKCSDTMGVDRNVTTTCRMPGMMCGCSAPSKRSSRQSTDSFYSPPSLPSSSGRSTGSAFASTEGHVYNAECCDDQFGPNGFFSDAEPCLRNQRTQGYNNHDSECEEHRSKNRNLEERKAQDSRCIESPDFEDCTPRNQRCQDAGRMDQNPRSSYFLNLSAMDRNSGQQNETRKLASTRSKSSALTPTDQGSRVGAFGQSQLTSRNIHRKNVAQDDQSLHSQMAEAAFVRGGARRSLQLPKDRPTASSRNLAGISPRVSEANRSFRTTNLINGGTNHNGSPTWRGKAADDKRIDVNSRGLNGSAKGPWPRLRRDTNEDKTQDDEDEGESTEHLMKVRFQEIYGTIRRKGKMNQRNAGSSSSSMGNGFGSMSQSTSLARLPQKSPVHDLLRGSVSPLYQQSGADEGSVWNYPVSESRNNLNRVYGSMSPMFSPGGRQKTGIPVLVGQQVAGGLAQSSISLSTKTCEPTNNTLHRNTNIKYSPGGQQPPLRGSLNGEDERDTDTASELSDVLSVFSMNGSTLMVDVLNNLASSTASIRKDGLSDLQYLLRSGALLSKKDVKRLTEIFTRMFHDPQAKVFSLFLEVLVDFINFHAEDLEEWIPICLNRLLTKVGADLLGSVQIKVQRALKTIRNTFPCDMQMYSLSRFVAEPLQTNNTKVKEAVLSHLHELILSMSPSDLNSDIDHQLLWTQLINWSIESKHSETKKSAQQLIIAIFNLNPPVFSLVLAKQPKTSQDFVRRILHSHLRMASNSIEEDDEIESEAHTAQESVRLERRNVPFLRDSVGRRSLQTYQRKTTQQFVCDLPDSQKKGSVKATDHNSQKSRKMDDATHDICSSSRDHVGLRRRGPKTSSLEQQQLLQINRMSEDSGIYFGSDETRDEISPDFRNDSVFSPDDKESNFYDINQNDIIYKAGNGQEQQQGENYSRIIKPGKLWVSGNISPCILDVVATFSDTSASEERRKQAMKQLIQTLPDNYEEIADSSLKATLGVLLLTSGGIDEVSDLADECISLLLKTQSAVKRIEILTGVVDESEFPINLAALKLQFSELQCLDSNDVSQILTKVVPSLIKAYEHNDRRVRKASLLSLVHLHKVTGDDLWRYICNINENKQNLLMMYFRRASPEKNITSTHL